MLDSGNEEDDPNNKDQVTYPVNDAKGNLWQELWESEKSIPAAKQAPPGQMSTKFYR